MGEQRSDCGRCQIIGERTLRVGNDPDMQH
jgi:hypothetical protein